MVRVKDDFRLKLPDQVGRCLGLASKRLRSFGRADFVTEELFGPSTHLLNGRGKLLRPALVFLGAHAIGERCVDFVDLAVAIELLHASSLVHDDLIDQGTTRRGTKTVNAKYGDSVALLAGDALISKAIQLSSKYGERMMQEASEAALRMCAGELMDYRIQKDGRTLSVDEYLRIAELKTASLMGTSCSIVAYCKGSAMTRALRRYGTSLGIAFQIRDDVLDFVNSDEYSGANIVASMKKRYGMDMNKAVAKAVELNNRYAKDAVRGLDQKRMQILGNYAKITELHLD